MRELVSQPVECVITGSEFEGYTIEEIKETPQWGYRVVVHRWELERMLQTEAAYAYLQVRLEKLAEGKPYEQHEPKRSAELPIAGVVGPFGFLAWNVACMCQSCLSDRTVMGFPVLSMRLITCHRCGNKRCPHAEDHRFMCTGSNEPGQKRTPITETENDPSV